MSSFNARRFGLFMKNVCLVIPPYVAFTDLFYTIRVVDGISMKPTLNPSGFNTDYVLLKRWSVARSQELIQKGEVVSLVSPKNPDQWLIKRIVALEGDEVKCHSCFEETVKIPKGHCWVEGDNLTCSSDSNSFGPVPIGLITAKAVRVLWPPKHSGVLSKKDFAKERVTDGSEVERGHMFFGWDVE